MNIPDCHGRRYIPHGKGQISQCLCDAGSHIDLLPLHGISALLLKEDLSFSEGGLC